ncbi:hypothetical protein THAOC_08126 [Thalassiosira oceanica]|uniref:DUF6743 domain-containing protein n=1 Tax=Thalassiosira oceanica TaxID=159749 RepID=K0TIV8_THAOC|nr:hypothetical protein THAOC_08126 [Thalassiosira oceanica]|eukprot:EJK70507.1 hypothetical protein THAOC_08126 [Thalassiosira oceanica]
MHADIQRSWRAKVTSARPGVLIVDRTWSRQPARMTACRGVWAQPGMRMDGVRGESLCLTRRGNNERSIKPMLIGDREFVYTQEYQFYFANKVDNFGCQSNEFANKFNFAQSTYAAVKGGKKDMSGRLTDLTGPHRHNWLNADEQGADARRHVAFRSGSPKNLRAPRAVVTRFGARPVLDAPYQPVDAADVRRRVVAFRARQDNNSRSGTAACIHRSRWSVDSSAALDVSNKLFSHPPIPGFVTGNWLNLALPSMFMLDSFELEMDWFSTDVLHPPRGLMEPLRGLHCHQGGPPGPTQGRAVWSWSAQLGPLPPVLGPLPLDGLTSSTRLVRLSTTVRLHALVGKKDGWTYLTPTKNETRLPGAV